MEREHEYLLHLLGAYIKEEQPDIAENADWAKLMQLAHIHNVSGILGYMSMSYPICQDRSLNASLRSICLNTMTGYAQRAALAEMFSQELAQNGIDHILMKGYVLRNYYPVPELRTFGDIDVVIKLDDRVKCDTLMRKLGYHIKNDWEPVFSYIKDSEYYEIHTQIMEVDVSEKADYRKYFQNAWQHVTRMEDHRYQFVPEFHFLYMLTHIAKHVTGSGAGVRMYLDVATFIRYFGDTLNWEYIRQELKAISLADFANIVLAVVQKCFGVSSPIPLKPVQQNTLDDFIELTMNGGIFGRAGQDSGTLSLKNQSRDHGEVSRVGTVVQRIFPSAQSIQSRYTYLQDKPWLLPAAWVHRLIKTRASWQKHAEEAQNILSADKETVRKLNRLYEDIGL